MRQASDYSERADYKHAARELCRGAGQQIIKLCGADVRSRSYDYTLRKSHAHEHTSPLSAKLRVKCAGVVSASDMLNKYN